jgi:hypothetical protein
MTRAAAGFTLLLGAVALGAAAATGCTGSRMAAAASTGGGAAPMAFPVIKPFFVAGETITWEMTMAGITGARARLAVGEPSLIDGKQVVVLRAEAESAGIAVLLKEMRSSISSWVDAESGVPTRTESDSFGINNTFVVHAERRAGEGGDPFADMRISKKSGEIQEKVQRLPVVQTHDPLSAALVLRAWTPPKGTRAVLYSLGGSRLWKTVLTVEGIEEMKTAIGKRKVLRISGVSIRMKPSLDEDKSKPPRSFTVWVTDDDQRVPVKLTATTELGDLVVKATSYEASSESSR